MRQGKFTGVMLALLFLIVFPSAALRAQSAPAFSLTDEQLQKGVAVELGKLPWKYQPGDDPGWAAPEIDDRAWEILESSKIDPKNPPQSGWSGRGWFRLRFNVDEKLAGRNLALIPLQSGASEVYLDGKLLARFGSIGETGVIEYNPNRLPIPFRIDRAGEHVLAVRYASLIFADMSRGFARRLIGTGDSPGFYFAIRDASDLTTTIGRYANESSMRGGFLFAGFLFALALLHFLLYLFYRVERANLYYSFFAAALAVNILCGNYRNFGHLGSWDMFVLAMVRNFTVGLLFTLLPAFLLVAFRRPAGSIFRALVALWVVSFMLNLFFIDRHPFIQTLPSILIGVSFTYCIFLLIQSLREKQPGAWILLGGVVALQFGMLAMLLRQFNLLHLPPELYPLAELSIILGVPVSVSIFLARKFARTNRHLEQQLAEVERLSAEQIEHERRAAELRAENERRAEELEEARQLQLSMLPKRLPDIAGLEIAAYMKPATEVGGDYYDFHVSPDGTLTVAVGDATGHGLKAGSIVTATKSLFNAFAGEPDLARILQKTSAALKAMNLRGLFMAITMIKVKGERVGLGIAGMPSVLIYRAARGSVEEVAVRAVPLGSMMKTNYREQETTLSAGDVVVLMSDGFPEMFNERGEMIGFEKAAQILPGIAHGTAQEIIDYLVKTGESWSNGRPPDDDVTFVVVKVAEIID